MNTKVLLVCTLLVFAPLANAQTFACALSTLTAGFCTANVCLLDLSAFSALCAGVGTPIITINLPSAVTVNVNGVVSSNIAGLTINANASTSATVNLNSIVNIGGDLIVSGNAVVKAAAASVVSVSGKIQVAAQASLQIAGNVTAQGTVVVNGNIHLAGSVVASAAQTAWLIARTASSISISGSASASASITGNGGIDGSVALSGNVTFAAGNSPGVVYINGDLSMSSTTTLEIDVDSMSSFDKLIISGKFNRDGILFADFETSYVPDAGTKFLFASHSSSSGTFNLAHGNFGDETFTNVKPTYESLSTSFQYGSAANIAIPVALIALCLLSLVF